MAIDFAAWRKPVHKILADARSSVQQEWNTVVARGKRRPSSGSVNSSGSKQEVREPARPPTVPPVARLRVAPVQGR